jgi:4-hydroxy-tetrahydrodipicolinate reductase
MIRIAITGAAGRMGGRIAALALAEGKNFQVVSAMEMPAHKAMGADVGVLAGAGPCGVAVSETLQGSPQVIIDFSTPEGTLKWLAAARQRNLPMVIGTTGLTESQLAEVADAAAAIAIVQSPNMSVGVNLLLRIVGEVARTLAEDYDIEIVEVHHRFKKDAPSGTALALARAIGQATGRDIGKVLVHGRSGQSPRKSGQIGMHAVRVGDTVGEHTVYFGNLGETLTFSHSAHTRDTFARGALRAAGWVVGRKPGLYTMQDVLFG